MTFSKFDFKSDLTSTQALVVKKSWQTMYSQNGIPWKKDSGPSASTSQCFALKKEIEKKEKEIKELKESQHWANDKIENLEGKVKNCKQKETFLRND